MMTHEIAPLCPATTMRHREGERQRDRQTDRQAGRQAQTDRQTGKEANGQTYITHVRNVRTRLHIGKRTRKHTYRT